MMKIESFCSTILARSATGLLAPTSVHTLSILLPSFNFFILKITHLIQGSHQTLDGRLLGGSLAGQLGLAGHGGNIVGSTIYISVENYLSNNY